MQRLALEARRKLKGDDGLETACYDEALRIRRKALGNIHPRVSSSLNKAGRALETLGRVPEAEAHFLEALDINRKIEGAGGFGTAWSLSLLGNCAWRTGRYDEAEASLRESVAIYRKLSNPRESASLISVLASLEGLIREKDQTGEADALAREIAEAKRRQ